MKIVFSMLSVPGLLLGCGAGWDGSPINSSDNGFRNSPSDLQIIEASIANIQAGMDGGTFTAEVVVAKCIERIHQIDQAGPTLFSVIAINPDTIWYSRSL